MQRLIVALILAAIIPCKKCSPSSLLVESLDSSALKDFEDAVLKQLEQTAPPTNPDTKEMEPQSSQQDSSLHRQVIHSKGNCHTLPSEIHVTKDETDESGNVIRTCEGTIVVTKCEGTCRSELRPSVSSPTGLLKECYCCRESSMQFKLFSLTECFSPDGVRITHPDSKAVMEIKMKEPSGCSCHTCGQ